jgi:hypothetical protein
MKGVFGTRGRDWLYTYIIMIYPLVICYIAIENCPFIVDLPMKNMVIFHSYVSLPEGITYVNTISME